LRDIQVTPDEDFQNITMEDMRRFVFKTLGLCHEFYKKDMLKLKIFEFGSIGYAKEEEVDIQI